MSDSALSIFRILLLFVAISFPTTLQSQVADRKTDWLYRGKIGLSTHYLAHNLESLEPLAKQFQVEKIADQAAKAGAAWFLFTIHHEPWLMMAPNAAYDRIVGDTNHTSRRDVPLLLYEELRTKSIRMVLYVNIRLDSASASAASDRVRTAMGGWPPNDKLIDNMAEVYKVFSLRYGNKVSGWWVDSAGLREYRQSPHGERWLKQIADALRAGNPSAIVAFNSGVRMERYSQSDYTAGEMNDLAYLPNGRWLDGAQWHAFTFLGGWWGSGGTRFSDRTLIEYSTKVISHGGVLTFDVGTLGTNQKKRGDPYTRTPHLGYLDPMQTEQAALVIQAVKAKQGLPVH